MRRKRYQRGSIKKRCGKWIGQWREDGRRKNRVIGDIRRMSKSEALKLLAKIITEVNAASSETRSFNFGEFVQEVYFPYYRRKWKRSTAEANVNRIMFHLVSEFEARCMSDFRREELQDMLDVKTQQGLSFSVVDHLRWDLKQIFDMAVAEGAITRNPALLLFTPRNAPRPKRLVMTVQEVQVVFHILAQRERLIVKLAVLAGMRPGEIYALTWGDLRENFAEVVKRVYRGDIDVPKTVQSVRRVALSEGLIAEVNGWRASFRTRMHARGCFHRRL
jgi:integrase